MNAGWCRYRQLSQQPASLRSCIEEIHIVQRPLCIQALQEHSANISVGFKHPYSTAAIPCGQGQCLIESSGGWPSEFEDAQFVTAPYWQHDSAIPVTGDPILELQVPSMAHLADQGRKIGNPGSTLNVAGSSELDGVVHAILMLEGWICKFISRVRQYEAPLLRERLCIMFRNGLRLWTRASLHPRWQANCPRLRISSEDSGTLWRPEAKPPVVAAANGYLGEKNL